MNGTLLRRTFSICPVCLIRIPARLVEDGGDVYMEKECPEHGRFRAVTWRESPSLSVWAGSPPEIAGEDVAACPEACGLCARHIQGTCCVLLEVTKRCNLTCAHCFAEAASGCSEPDPPLERVLEWITDIAAAGDVFLQLSGGEPTVRDDLPQMVRHARQAGCSYVQLNSNGLRLADDEGYVSALAEAGLSFVFMQFDGTSDAIHASLRGRPLLDAKLRAIEMCGRHGIGVTLVPTVVPGVNDHDVGNLLRLAVERSPLVRGVHFQPISYFGRYPRPPGDAERITLPEILRAVYGQAGELVPPDSIAPSCCDHPRCGFHGAYIVMPDGLRALTRPREQGCCSPPAPAENNRHFVGLRWQRPAATSCCGAGEASGAGENAAACPDVNSLDGFLSRARSHSFTISAMAFQDAHTLDLERLRQCSLHVYREGTIVPFCANYILSGHVGNGRKKRENINARGCGCHSGNA